MAVKHIAIIAISLLVGVGIGYCIGNGIFSKKLVTGGNIMQQLNEKDFDGVKQAINDYINAGKQGSSDILRPSVYKDAIIYSAPMGKVDGGTMDSLFEFLDGNPAATDMVAEIVAIDIAGDVAYAKVESDNWLGARYTDMFLLVRDGDKWKILTKVFHTHSK